MTSNRFVLPLTILWLGGLTSSVLANPLEPQPNYTPAVNPKFVTELSDLSATLNGQAESPNFLSAEETPVETEAASPQVATSANNDSELPTVGSSEFNPLRTTESLSADINDPKTVNPRAAQLVRQPAPQSQATPSIQSSDLSGLQAQGIENTSAQDPLRLSPLEQEPIRLFNLDTANQLPAGALQFGIDFRRFPSEDLPNAGTGLQIYSGSVDWGVTDKLQLGLSASLFDDELPRLLVGAEAPLLQTISVAPTFKYQLLNQDRLSVGVSGSAELLRIVSDPGIFNPTLINASGNYIVGTVAVPVSYRLAPELQAHFTPGLAIFPGDVQGADFYGTFFNLGAGVSWQPLQRVGLFADVNLPVGPGGNAVRLDGSVFRKPVFSGGVRFLVNPAVGLDLYATNAFGLTPATRLLSFIPEGDQVAFGARLNFTPDLGQGYAASFRQGPRVRLSERDRQLLLDGFTLTSADTLLPQMLRLRVGIGAGTNFNLAYGLTHDAQIEIIGADFDEGEAFNSINYGSGFKFGPAAKLRLLDQVQGDPVSLALKAGAVVDLSTQGQLGIPFVTVPIQYRPTPEIALSVNPQVAFIRSEALVGVGLGINYALLKDVQLIGEFTPVVTGEPSVWSAGVRYLNPDLNLGVDLYGSNAISQNTIGGLVAQSGATVGVNLHWLLGGTQEP